MTKIYERKLAGLTFKEIIGDPNAPSVILLHGYGADENDLISLSQTCIGTQQRPNFYFPRAPLEVHFAPGYVGRSWFPIDVERLRMATHENRPQDISSAFPEFFEARRLCEGLIDALNIPLSKLFIGGFSQGAVLSTDIALNARERIGGLLVLSGTLIHAAQWHLMATKHKGLHFFQSHGKHDPLLPFSQAEALTKMFLDHQFEGQMHAFDGGHEIPHSIFLKLNSFFKNLI